MMKYRNLHILLLGVMVLLGSGCTTGIYDGMRVTNTASSVTPAGYVTSAPTATSKVRIQAYNPASASWVIIRDNVAISSSVSWTTADGTELYSWNAGSLTIPAAYWTAGTGGSYARLRAQWCTGSSCYNTVVSRQDRLQCFLENFNGEGNTISYMLDNCFSHRGQAYIYTANYREGSSTCAAPAAALAKTNDHYMIQQVPSCARTIIGSHMREKIDETSILLHYEINHNSSGPVDSKNALPNDTGNTCNRQPGADGICELGGFFGAHERYIRRMERHVMVYDYPWMPIGKIPAWNGNTAIPVQFRNAEVSPSGSCNSWTCDGWRSDPITDTTPGAVKPASIYPGTVCSFASVSAVAGATSGWHAGGHTLTGGHFGTFDSPANPLFFLWHNAINDVWVDYRNCP